MTDLEAVKRACGHDDSSNQSDTEYDFPDFVKRDWEVSQEAKEHMDSVAEQQRVAEQKSGEWRFG
ncbi:hypothetical protein [Kordiimonas sp.]|uniref:hypothetical protein n=1 Tax=Kordiimonas sp. TaxID=1970157 RepID=UPI003A90672D